MVNTKAGTTYPETGSVQKARLPQKGSGLQILHKMDYFKYNNIKKQSLAGTPWQVKLLENSHDQKKVPNNIIPYK